MKTGGSTFKMTWAQTKWARIYEAFRAPRGDGSRTRGIKVHRIEVSPLEESYYGEVVYCGFEVYGTYKASVQHWKYCDFEYHQMHLWYRGLSYHEKRALWA